jgi:phosphate starvation-inducible PhoH-like protein
MKSKRKSRQANETNAAPAKDTSPYVDKKRAKPTIELSIRDLPWTDKQKRFFELAHDKTTRIVIVKGVAGTSKTLLAVHTALQKMKQKKITEIYYSRVPVESSIHGIGFIKGTADEKMTPYVQPLVDKMNELLPDPQIKALMGDNRIIGLPLGFLRGLNISNAVFIMDEAQNCRIEDFLLVMTRMANFSTLFVLGDIQQSDVRNSGFEKVYNLFDNDKAKENGIHTFEFGKEDIVRSEILSYIIESFEDLRK